MKKCVFSIAIMTTFTTLSIVAFTSSSARMPVDEISEQMTVSETAAVIEPETTTEPRQSVTEVAPYRSALSVAHCQYGLECRGIISARKNSNGRGRE